jgi:hypothetical protein
MIEFDCVECGDHVVALALNEPPPSRRCATCQWLADNIDDPVEREKVRARLDHVV